MNKLFKKVALSTTIFPIPHKYLHDFFSSLMIQSYTNFDVIVLNDGFIGLDEFIKEYSDLNIVEIDFNGPPAKNREFSINYIKNNSYDFVIFGDCDDYFSSNRVEFSLQCLEKYDVVVNDVTLFKNSGIYNENFFSNRIYNNTEISLDFIKNKNIFGLSNTAVKVSILENIFFVADLIAVDWFLFSILLMRGHKAIFTNSMTTYYRQHDNNAVGLGEETRDGNLKNISVKSMHYFLLKDKDVSYIALYQDVMKLSRSVKSSSLDEVLISERIKNPLWWEEAVQIK